MNNPQEIKRTAQQWLAQPIHLQDSKSSTTRNVAGGILFAFFAFLGFSILVSGFKSQEYQAAYIAFGVVLLAFPVFVFLLINTIKKKIIKVISSEGVLVNNGNLYHWETLKSITFHTTESRYRVDNLNHIYMIDFHFAEGDARSSYMFHGFANVEFIADKLPVSKKNKTNAYHR
ncbi:MAG: hypothetical protein U0U67_02840 [Chitinophagales bacterium]